MVWYLNGVLTKLTAVVLLIPACTLSTLGLRILFLKATEK